jgi:hypothetical protein
MPQPNVDGQCSDKKLTLRRGPSRASSPKPLQVQIQRLMVNAPQGRALQRCSTQGPGFRTEEASSPADPFLSDDGPARRIRRSIIAMACFIGPF